MKSIRDFDLENKKVIIRCDFNVPIKDEQIIDDNRIQMSLETIRYAVNHSAKVILMSHLGRIKTKDDLTKNSLEIVAHHLSTLLNRPVLFSKDTRGSLLESLVASLKCGDVLLVENTRYEDLDGKRESNNDEDLGKYWASLGDIFINDAFGVSHRSPASVVGIATYLPNGCGFLLEKEIKAMEALDEKAHPYVILLGGAKVSDKIGLISNLIQDVDKLLIGGGMAYTFLKAKGYEVGNSLVDEENIAFCQDMISKYSQKICLPVDSVVTSSLTDTVSTVEKVGDFSYNVMGVDIGPDTVTLFEKVLENAKTVLWNGPMGVYENENYAKGTVQILEYLTVNNIKTILGGGDTVAAASLYGYKDKVYHASTGGGAMLEYLEGKTLPGIEVLNLDKKEK